MKRNARAISGKGRPAFRLDKTLRTLRDHFPELRERYGVRSLSLFGSHVRGSQHKRSDLDVLVELDDPRLSLLKFIALERHLSNLVGIKVDLVEKDTLKPAIGRHILEEVVSV
ncbi:MAG TPA: nucleotidyltransferase family protein [Candidatus Methylomirabilis sp.]|nr:nucleotidyltransferase family protein [Candidatus Methylomirabilis sp.]HSB78252.1 nucleotidyltransferase family protein [Candidatus Methylomirabilis sp.]HSC69842.1 nucleotidyltransferase family protein [Candidatus Methylomirabilis sp.]